ncbi:MAG: hypothetical protein ABJH93_14490, partial [Roseibium sp.]|uniref:hypothetical protein n=1 Tax=Roseibium sp. TaxID=1936156 RepID=UPI0032981896
QEIEKRNLTGVRPMLRQNKIVVQPCPPEKSDKIKRLHLKSNLPKSIDPKSAPAAGPHLLFPEPFRFAFLPNGIYNDLIRAFRIVKEYIVL